MRSRRAFVGLIGFVLVAAALAAFYGRRDDRTASSSVSRNAPSASVASARDSSPPSPSQVGDYQVSFPVTPKASTSSDVIEGTQVVQHILSATTPDGDSYVSAMYVDYAARAGAVFDVDKALEGASDSALKGVESEVGIGKVHVVQNVNHPLADLAGRYVTAHVDPDTLFTMYIGCRAKPSPRCYFLEVVQGSKRSFSDDAARSFVSSFVPNLAPPSQATSRK